MSLLLSVSVKSLCNSNDGLTAFQLDSNEVIIHSWWISQLFTLAAINVKCYGNIVYYIYVNRVYTTSIKKYQLCWFLTARSWGPSVCVCTGFSSRSQTAAWTTSLMQWGEYKDSLWGVEHCLTYSSLWCSRLLGNAPILVGALSVSSKACLCVTSRERESELNMHSLITATPHGCFQWGGSPGYTLTYLERKRVTIQTEQESERISHIKKHEAWSRSILINRRLVFILPP